MNQHYTSFLNQIPTKLRGKYISLYRNNKRNMKDLLEELEIVALETKDKQLPKIIYPNLPVSDKVDELKKLIQNNQVVVIAGETGSGKSTQLPKICLDLGLGKRGFIGHTQPRRLAARSIANRVGAEIADSSKVSYKIRFSDQTDENTLVKVMTDGVLLSEIKNDKYLSQYEVIIIDEAHERSLNIDFLMGCIKKILPYRPDLKVIITSATIDYQKFIQYFDNAKAMTIEGRTYPVEIRYQDDDDFLDFSLQERILYAIDELNKGDILVFLPTERDIHETLAYLNKQQLRFTEVLPLFSRLSNKDQNKIFNPEGSTRRIILATNVAETSLTVPRIKYVIDSGLARVSRYSYRTKVQRLPIEKISKASANQRAGRCGRLSSGVCVRLYSEEDFNSRKDFTEPEILRTNLAAVILQMMYLGLGAVQEFPFIDKPDDRFIRDGYKLLFELKAIDKLSYTDAKITADGSKMATMPLDPKLAKIIIESHKLSCLREILTIVSFLSVQDPRERPLNAQQQSDQKHAVDTDKDSDFLTILNLANRVSKDIKDLSNRERREYFKKNYISVVRFNEWRDIYRQIAEVVHSFKWKFSAEASNYENVHKALVSGLLSNIGYNYELAEYLGARGHKFFIFPGSSQFKRKPKWLFSSEIVETTKTYARNVAKIEPEWLENLASHLVKKNYDEPIWSKKRRAVVVNERVSLYGLEIISKKSVQYARINQENAREIFIREALVNGEFSTKAKFFNRNIELLDKIDVLESKSRRRDILVDEEIMFGHYNKLVPKEVFDGVSFEKWLKKLTSIEEQKLVFDINELMQHDANNITQEKFPDALSVGQLLLPLKYNFDPTAKDDGILVRVPLAYINSVSPMVLEWGVYGFLYERVVAYLRALPKNIRKLCVPVPNYAQAIVEAIDFDKDRLKPLKSILAYHITRIVGFKVEEGVWGDIELENHLVFNIEVIDKDNKVLVTGKDIISLKKDLENKIEKPKQQQKQVIYYEWDFGDIVKNKKILEYGIEVEVFGCLEPKGDGLVITYKVSQKEAQAAMKKSLFFLVSKKLKENTLTKIDRKKVSLSDLSTSMQLNSLDNQCINKTIELSFFGDSKLPYTQIEFEEFYQKGIKQFDKNKVEVEKLFMEIGEKRKQLEKQLEVKKIPLNMIELFHNVKSELQKLFDEDFLSVPLIYLQRYRFYLQAQIQRLEKAKQNPQRDRAYNIEIEELEHKLVKVIKDKHLSLAYKNIVKIKFLIKELWVSWYLQEVKTIETVSSKRILKYISSLSNEIE